MFHPSLKTSIQARTIADMLMALSVGHTLTYDQMASAIGIDVRAHRRHVIRKALKIARAEAHALFENVIGVGYQRLPSEDVPAIGARTRRGIRRIAKRKASYIEDVVTHANDISDSARRDAFSEIGTLRLAALITTDRAKRSVNPSPEGPPPSVAESLKGMMDKLRGLRS